MRGYLSNPKFLKSKVANSQSPIQKKRLLEFATHNLKTDKSMQGLSSKGNLNSQTSNSTKVIDFRREIDRRFQNSLPNQTYVFPRATQQASSSNSSFDSLRDVGEYDLHTQDFKRSILMQRERASLDARESMKQHKNKSFETPFKQQIQHIDQKLASVNNKALEVTSMTHREYSREKHESEDYPVGTPCKKFIKPAVLKNQRNVGTSNPKQKAYNREQIEENTHNSMGYRKGDYSGSYKQSGGETSPKTINLNVNVNMNMNIDYKDAQDSNNSRSKLAISPPAKAECFINCNFFPKTLTSNHSSKDLKVNTSKNPNYFGSLYKNLELKTLQTGGLSTKDARKGTTPTTSSTVDKSVTSFKSSHSLIQNETEKAFRQSKAQARGQKIKQSNDSHANGSSLSSSLRREDSNTSRGEGSKTQRNLKSTALYQKMQHDILKKIKLPESIKDYNPNFENLHNFVPGSLTTRPTVGHNDSKQKVQSSPKMNNFFFPTTANVKGKNSGIAKNSKEFAMTDRLSLTSKEGSSKREDDLPNKYFDVKKLEGKKELTMSQRIKLEKSKMKLNLHGITQRLGPFSDRAGQSSERSEQKNKSHAEYFR